MPISVRRTLLAMGIAIAMATPLRAGSYRWTTSGPEPGYIFQIVVSPEDPAVALASAGFWGPLLYRTVNGGANWAQQDNSTFGSSRLLPHPSDSRILYMLGWADGRQGVLKSTDGGLSWQPASSGLPADSNYSAIALGLSSPQILYVLQAASPPKVFRSDDGAASWFLATGALPQNYGADLAVDPSDPSILYIASNPDVLKSEDSGATWNPAGTVPAPACLRIVPSAPSTIYAGTNAAGVYKTVDGGQTWNPANTGIADQPIRDLAIDPANSQKLFAATNPAGSAGGLFVTTNGGQSWSPVDLGQPQSFVSAVTIYAPDPSIVYAAAGYGGQRGGLFRSEDGGQTWESASKGLSGFYTNGVAAHPAIPGAAYCVSIANVYRSDSGGTDWALQGAPTRGLNALIADPYDGDTLYGGFSSYSGEGGVFKSEDGGATWQDASQGLSISQFWRFGATSVPDRLLAATADGLFQTSDGAGSWSPLLSGDVRAAAADTLDTSILYAGLASVGPAGYALVRSDDAGVSWPTPAGIPAGGRVHDVRTPSGEPDRVYVAASNGVLRSSDRGLSFSPANEGLPAIPGMTPFRLAPDPSATGTLYLLGFMSGATAESPWAPSAESFGNVFRTVDGADSWARLPGFLFPFGALDLSVDVSGRVLYASTAGGAYQFERAFLDLPDTDPFWTAIDAAAMNGVTSGCGAGRFCPTAALSRGSVSVFLLRGKNGAGFEPPPASGAVFGDVSANSPAAGFIEELFHQGISVGCGGGNYCSGAELTRAAMAILLLKTKHGSTYTPPPATGAVFSDVPADAFAADWIEQLYAEGITAGCGSGNFCPNASVSRAQAAALVVRAFGLS